MCPPVYADTSFDGRPPVNMTSLAAYKRSVGTVKQDWLKMYEKAGLDLQVETG
jgi:hypothetical protein